MDECVAGFDGVIGRSSVGLERWVGGKLGSGSIGLSSVVLVVSIDVVEVLSDEKKSSSTASGDGVGGEKEGESFGAVVSKVGGRLRLELLLSSGMV